MCNSTMTVVFDGKGYLVTMKEAERLWRQLDVIFGPNKSYKEEMIKKEK